MQCLDIVCLHDASNPIFAAVLAELQKIEVHPAIPVNLATGGIRGLDQGQQATIFDGVVGQRPKAPVVVAASRDLQ
jgi:hypothetical protein